MSRSLRSLLVSLMVASSLAVAASCAPLNVSTLPDWCRRSYEACLDACERQRPRVQPVPATATNNQFTLDTETPKCVERCNADAKRCAAPQPPK